MGLLDDAIREHLDLKRRRGADPTEIERAEREALGPVRRSPEELEEDGLAVGLPEDEADSYEYEPPGQEVHLEEEPIPPEEPSYPSPERPLAEPEAPLPEQELTAEQAELEGHPPPHPADLHPSPAEPVPSDETVEYSLEDDEEVHDKTVEDSPEDEDMLEETPEFLQDTPDHDRLWFEQRPPRDFDLGN